MRVRGHPGLRENSSGAIVGRADALSIGKDTEHVRECPRMSENEMTSSVCQGTKYQRLRTSALEAWEDRRLWKIRRQMTEGAIREVTGAAAERGAWSWILSYFLDCHPDYCFRLGDCRVADRGLARGSI